MFKLRLQLQFVFVVILVTACGSAQSSVNSPASSENPVKAAGEPMKLSLFLGGGQLSDDEFQQYFVKLVEQKYPNITMEFIKKGKGTQITDLVAAGTVPDIIFTPQASMEQFLELNLQMDIRELMKKYNVSEDKFNPLTIDGIKNYSTKDVIYGLPLSYNFSALFYNKDIFDKFGVPYHRINPLGTKSSSLRKKWAD